MEAPEPLRFDDITPLVWCLICIKNIPSTPHCRPLIPDTAHPVKPSPGTPPANPSELVTCPPVHYSPVHSPCLFLYYMSIRPFMRDHSAALRHFHTCSPSRRPHPHSYYGEIKRDVS
ncbi:hypothetical protein E2C01_074827 [Portunus trituberculatus]|uniref:Uncharacterized protein n=1 Tax=Portunus trituberculatus TaxID=210409 RepID=A0A5B7ID89_PORTR|nr:hypothetical protein [Portunus trituberculatus]